MNLELLETRDAPATLSYVDVDGDNVVIKTSGPGALIAGTNVLFDPTGHQLRTLILQDAAFQGANVSIAASRDPVHGGDGFVNVGFIRADGRDLGTVLVDGDLGRIDAGDPTNPASACKSLTVLSIGRFGTSTGAPDLLSQFDGQLGKLTVKSDVTGAYIIVADSAGTNGKIGTVFIGGSLIGGAGVNSGSIIAVDGFGFATIKGDILGGGGQSSGVVACTHDLGGVKVGGSLVGGTGPSSGVIFSAVGQLGSIRIGGNIVGGTAVNSGRVFGNTKIVSALIGGSLAGGTGAESGKIHSGGDIGPVLIARNMIGGDGDDSGKIDAQGGLTSLRVGGSVIGGAGRQDINFTHEGQIFARSRLSSVTIGGSLIGGNDPDPTDTTRRAIAGGSIFSFAGLDSLKIGGSIIGGNADDTGRIFVPTILSSLDVGDSIIGGTGFNSGYVQVDKLASMEVGGDISSEGAIFATQLDSIAIRGSLEGKLAGVSASAVKIGRDLAGFIDIIDTLGSLTVGGSLVGASASGGALSFTGAVRAGEIGSVKIGGDIQGGSISGSAFLNQSGSIVSGGRIDSVLVGGSIISGSDASSSQMWDCATIRADDDIGSLTVKGRIIGNVGDGLPENFTPVIISARGQKTIANGATTDVAIGKITVGGRVERAQILAGYTWDSFGALTPMNADAQIGTVTVGGDWIASSLFAGVTGGGNNFIGDSDDVKMSGTGVKDNADNLGAISKIEKVIIGGRALGTADSSDRLLFGMEAQQIESIEIGGASVALTSGASNDLFFTHRLVLGTTHGTSDPDGFDFHAFEVP